MSGKRMEDTEAGPIYTAMVLLVEPVIAKLIAEGVPVARAGHVGYGIVRGLLEGVAVSDQPLSELLTWGSGRFLHLYVE